jgi:hypothetical protein
MNLIFFFFFKKKKENYRDFIPERIYISENINEDHANYFHIYYIISIIFGFLDQTFKQTLFFISRANKN